MNKLQRGFTLVESLLIILIIAIIGFGGYWVWHNHRNNTNSGKPTSSSNEAETSSQPTLDKTYTSPDYGFAFKYPSSWKLVTNLSDYGRGGPEGEIYVQSPAGTKVHFDPNFGGKGGDCVDAEANYQRTTRTCTTRTIISVSKLSDSGSQPIWLEEGSNTDPTSSGGKTAFFIYLSSGDSNYDVNTGKSTITAPKPGTNIGAFLGSWDDVQLEKVALNVSVEGSSNSASSASAFFNSNEAKEALPILESFKVL